jgi:hypothetical protein
VLAGGEIALTRATLFGCRYLRQRYISHRQNEKVAGTMPGVAEHEVQTICPAWVGPTSPGPCIQPGRTKLA